MFRGLSAFLLVVGLLSFVYGAMKLTRSQSAPGEVFDAGNGVQVVLDSPGEDLARNAFIVSALLVGAGAVGLAASRKKRVAR